MVAELLAVVAGEHDERVVPLAGLAQEAQHMADLVVDLRNQPVVRGAHQPDLGLRHRRSQAVAVAEELRLLHGLHVVRE